MTPRSRFENALNEWNDSVDRLNRAINGFMDDGLQTNGGTWIVTMNPALAEALRSARQFEEKAKARLARIVDEVCRLEGDHPQRQSMQSES